MPNLDPPRGCQPADTLAVHSDILLFPQDYLLEQSTDESKLPLGSLERRHETILWSAVTLSLSVSRTTFSNKPPAMSSKCLGH